MDSRGSPRRVSPGLSLPLSAPPRPLPPSPPTLKPRVRWASSCPSPRPPSSKDSTPNLTLHPSLQSQPAPHSDAALLTSEPVWPGPSDSQPGQPPLCPWAPTVGAEQPCDPESRWVGASELWVGQLAGQGVCSEGPAQPPPQFLSIVTPPHPYLDCSPTEKAQMRLMCGVISSGPGRQGGHLHPPGPPPCCTSHTHSPTQHQRHQQRRGQGSAS